MMVEPPARFSTTIVACKASPISGATVLAVLSVTPPGPKGTIKAVVTPIRKRMPLYSHYDKSVTEIGRTTAAEWADEVEFMGLQEKIKDTSVFFTNDLIAEINRFDRQAVIDAARAFKIPAQ